ncbi:MAG: hypothetical protein UX31_C0001G0015 [Candidatus Nomurabacteria bacterium GW2011_GWA1_46_11]|uniref:Uncharacterized protein n=2 Tax=Parcubacteria group TaxID=1794811 RepID=A0A1F8F037_9BACT|nr:MAG: hypothetical protein UX31_C0001G0015 [Candidatus Nomurabacteria bacterium GW2011_GWA1_46_11]OGN06048.1 MAG: hypothetical protein A2669_00765 [Candidatus Yanofskybacteria bacterium RIFCSPHIGHO2_01_FULL_48_25b]
MEQLDKTGNSLMTDFVIVVFSIFIAVVLVRTEMLTDFLTSTKELEIFGSFIAGMFFTSVFTTAPAIVTLGEIANANSIILTAVFGAFGAVIGDIIIFSFVRDRLSIHLLELVKHRGVGKRLRALIKMKYFRWFTFLAGGLIIASPFPDEIGIGLMGFTRLRLSWFVPISLVFNFIGIMVIGLIARTF